MRVEGRLSHRPGGSVVPRRPGVAGVARRIGSMVAGLVLAAGAGRRFGAALKQLAPFGGRAPGEQPGATPAAAGLAAVFVVRGAPADVVEAGADLAAAPVVRCADWADGQGRALAAGVGA